MKASFRPVVVFVAVLGLSLAGVSASWAGDDPKAESTTGAIKAEVDEAAKAVEKQAEEKFDEATYKEGEKPGDLYKDTASPPAQKPASPPAPKPTNPAAK